MVQLIVKQSFKFTIEEGDLSSGDAKARIKVLKLFGELFNCQVVLEEFRVHRESKFSTTGKGYDVTILRHSELSEATGFAFSIRYFLNLKGFPKPDEQSELAPKE